MASDAQAKHPDFSVLLRRARRAAGLTQEELAERAGISARGISDVERGVYRAPRKDTLDLLADALGLSDEERAVWEKARTRLASRSSQPASVETSRHAPASHLPAPLTTFIGREREAAEVAALLRRRDVRLLTLTGPGGIGKTRLGIVVAGVVGDDFPDGTVFVSLAPLGSPGLVIPTIAARLGLQESGEQPFLEALSDYFAPRRFLLVLDNVEHVLDAAPAIATLLSAAPLLTVLATSRIALHLSGEHLYAVPPLALPDPERLPDLERMTGYEAVRLFVERARLVMPGLEITDANAALLTAICRQLDGLPLAIELAAARLRTLAPAALLDRLERRLPLLTGGPRDAPARQQTLRDTIGWSHDLLDDGEQRLFRRLSVFAGGWTLDAADAVADLDRDLAGGTLDSLSSLVEKSLVIRQAQTGPDADALEPRVEMLETIREFGLEQLTASGEEEHVRQRHANYVLALAESQEALYEGPEQIAALDRLEQEHANTRVAIDWFASRGDAESGLRLAGALGMFWQVHGHLSEGLRQYARLLALPEEGVSAKVRAHALTGAGILAEWQSDLDATVAFMEEALSIWLDLPLADQYGAWRSLSCLGDVAHTRGDLVGAQARYEEELAHAKRVGNARGVAAGYLLLGNVAVGRGELDEAVALFETSRAHAAAVGDTWLLTMSAGNLAHILLLRGDIEGARPHFETTIAIQRRMGHKRQMASCLSNLGWIASLQGQPERARTLLDEALALANQIGARQESAYALNSLGEVAHQSGDLDLAGRHCREGLRIAWSIQAMDCVIQNLGTLARVGVDRGDPERAARLCGAVEQQREQFDIPLMPVELPGHERLLGSLRGRLSETEFERLRLEGRAMSMEAAVEYALEPLP